MSSKTAVEVVIKSATIQKKTLTVVFSNGKTFSADNSLKNFSKLKAAIKARNAELALRLVSAAENINKWSQGKLVVDHKDNVFYDKHRVDPRMHRRLLQMIEEKADVSYLVNFLDNLYLNPAAESIADLYEFLDAHNLPFTQDGCFLAFKRVRDDYKDFHTGNIDHSIGVRVDMDRRECQMDRSQECSTGLHFCQYTYLPHYKGAQGKILLVKVNPRDVTSIPRDYNLSKGRCCGYNVIAELKEGFKPSDIFKNITAHTVALKRSKKIVKQPKKLIEKKPRKAKSEVVAKAKVAKKKISAKSLTKAK